MSIAKFTKAAAVFLLTLTSGSAALAVEVLVNGNLESSVAPKDWSLTTSITGIPGSSIPSLFEHNDGSNNPPTAGLGLLFKPQAGNQGTYDGMNHKTNFVLEQTRPAIVGRTYTFTGETLWGGEVALADGYSGGVTLLHTGSPSDPTPENLTDPASVPSPTITLAEVAYLNSGGAVLGTPTTLDLRTVRENDSLWEQFSLSGGAAPTGTTQVRVRLSATDMITNYGYQDFLADNFTLRDNVVTGLERLLNANLNTPGEPAGWSVTEGPSGTVPGGGTALADVASFINFANHTSGGAQGLWFRPFVNTTQFDPDIPTVFGTMTQTVPATAGASYSFSAWTAWETGYAGGQPGSDNGVDTQLKMEFLNGSNAVIGSPTILDLYAAGMRADSDGGNIEPEDWEQFTIPATVAPAGTASVRVSIEALNMFNSFIEAPQSIFFDDLSLIETGGAGTPGDYNEDGLVDAADYVAWRKFPSLFNGDPTGYNTWRENFGEGGPGGGAAVPEPAALSLLLVSLAVLLNTRRRSA